MTLGMALSVAELLALWKNHLPEGMNLTLKEEPQHPRDGKRTFD